MKKSASLIACLASITLLTACHSKIESKNNNEIKSVSKKASFKNRSSKSDMKDIVTALNNETFSGFIFYKPTCKTCQAMEDDIMSAFNDVQSRIKNFHYIDATDGIPQELLDSIDFSELGEVQTPYLIILDKEIKTTSESEKLIPILATRLDNTFTIDSSAKAIMSITEDR